MRQTSDIWVIGNEAEAWDAVICETIFAEATVESKKAYTISYRDRNHIIDMGTLINIDIPSLSNGSKI